MTTDKIKPVYQKALVEALNALVKSYNTGEKPNFIHVRNFQFALEHGLGINLLEVNNKIK